MEEKWIHEKWAADLWFSGKVTRRRLLGLGTAAAGALGASMLVPAPWRSAFGQAKPYKIGCLQPLSGGRGGGQDGPDRQPNGRRPDQQVGWHQWPSRRADRCRL